MDLASKDFHKRLKRVTFFGILFFVTFSLMMVVVLSTQKISLFAISGDSMSPTLENGENVVVRQEKKVTQNQLVFFKKPTRWADYVDHNTILVKRIIAVPGNTLTFDGKEFKVNDETVYTLSDDNYECSAGEVGYSHTLTNKEIFVMGDNASVSLDSRRIFCDGKTDKMYLQSRDVIDHGNIILKF